MPRTTLRCPACGRPFPPPHRPAVCPDCGSPTDRPPPPPEPEAGAVTLLTGTTADDGNPYTVVGGKPIPRCPECNARLPADDAPACTACGWDRAAGRKLPKTFAPVHRTWEAGWPLTARVAAFAACQAINVATAALIYSVDGRAVASAGGFVVMVIVQAFLLGTFDRLDLVRTAKGKITLTQQWRIAFWPLETKTLRWRDCEEIRVMHAETGLMEWVAFFILLPTLPVAFAWYWFVIRPGHVKAALCKDLGDPVTPLYLGTNTARAEEITKVVGAVTGLPWRLHGA
jgi:hypothetical protein